MLVSPAEPGAIKNLLGVYGKVSTLPEQWGCDFLMFVNKRWVGVQRKEIKDLIASVEDGRLAREVAMMQRCDVMVLIVEGRVQWTTDGEMIGDGYGRHWTKKQWKGVLWSVRERGIWVEFTDGHEDTVTHLTWMEAWFGKGEHNSLVRRPGPLALWGNLSNIDYQRHLVMGIPGVGPELASRIISMYGMPFGWRITREDLEKVEGIGKKKAEKIWQALVEKEIGKIGEIGEIGEVVG